MAFYVSTGDIRESYQVLNIVATYVGIAHPAFGTPNYQAAFKQAVDALAVEAQKLGANGVIFIQFAPENWGALGMGLFASGTAVKVG